MLKTFYLHCIFVLDAMRAFWATPFSRVWRLLKFSHFRPGRSYRLFRYTKMFAMATFISDLWSNITPKMLIFENTVKTIDKEVLMQDLFEGKVEKNVYLS